MKPARAPIADQFPRVSRPVDVTDAELFPEIAAAIEHARKQREARNG